MLWQIFILEIKLDVTWSYVKRQTAKMTFEFLFFSSNPSLNHIKIEKCLLLFATNTNIFTLLFQRANDSRQKFHFCRLLFNVRPRNVKLNLSIAIVRLLSGKTMRRKAYEEKDVIRNKNLPTVFANSFNHNRARRHKIECE